MKKKCNNNSPIKITPKYDSCPPQFTLNTVLAETRDPMRSKIRCRVSPDVKFNRPSSCINVDLSLLVHRDDNELTRNINSHVGITVYNIISNYNIVDPTNVVLLIKIVY